jgi:hypothetical protein
LGAAWSSSSWQAFEHELKHFHVWSASPALAAAVRSAAAARRTTPAAL